RGKALEEPHLADAIRMTLEPHIEDVQLGIRVTVPRSRFADNAAHALLRILRELTLNAIRHGHATSIRIAGAISGEKALFSVSDNGTGFEVDSAPGIRQGHYGLQGVRERVRELKGTVVWTSSPGKGTKVKLTL
ncbi:MAG: hypothetical protein IKC14_00515, partial [Kiritimatiellae bacterium]|nr:hypothetical protein [Kiritimatiellia bacterium]